MNLRHLTPLSALPIALLILACASDEQLIVNRAQLELDACKRAETETFEVKFETGSPYVIYRSLCDSPVTNIRIKEKIDGNADVGPYNLQLRKNLDDGCWLLTGVSWPEFDQARSLDSLDSPADSDFDKAEQLLAQAETDAPKIAEIKELRLKFLLQRRKATKKAAETDKTSLGDAQPYFDQATAAATEQSNPDLNLRLRLQVLNYYDRFRQIAEDSSTPSEQSAEWDVASVKAIRQEANDAKKAGNDKLYKEKMAEAEQREKDNVKAAEQRQKDADAMVTLAAQLKLRQCKELTAARAVTTASADLRAQLDGFSSLGCPL